MTMVEKVAEAILATTEEAMFPDDAVKCARAAIEAMREPTANMKSAGFHASPHNCGGCRDQIETDEEWMQEVIIDPWQAMIDEALKGD